MTSDAKAIVDELIVSGLGEQQLALVLKLVVAMSTALSGGQSAGHADSPVENPADIMERQREKWRKQKRNQRENRRMVSGGQSGGMSTGHADNHCDVSLSDSQRGNREEGRTPSTALVVEGQKQKKRGTRMVAGSVMSADNLAFARQSGLSETAAQKAWDEFVDYWIGVPGHRGTKLDWSATWRNRIRTIASRVQDAKKSSVIGASDRLVERIRQFNEPAPRAIRGGEGEVAIRAIPKG
jgi:hypothetical protein